GRAAHGRSDGRRAMGGHDHAGRAGSFGAPADGTEIAGIGDLVETGQQRPLRAGELPRVRVAVRLAPGDDALVVACAGCLAELALSLDLNSRSIRLLQPCLGLERALGRPELEHLSPPAQGLPDGPAAVDLLARHRRRTSWKPSETSRASHPAA